MIYSSLSERLEHYSKIEYRQLIPQLPIIIEFNGRNFSRLCKDLKKPFDDDFDHAFLMAIFYTLKEIPSTVFAYQYADKALLILQPQKKSNPWMDNVVNRMISTSASIITGALKDLVAISDPPIQKSGDIVFETNVFTLPKLSEAANYCLLWQNKAQSYAVHQTCLAFLIPKHGKSKSLSLLSGKKNFEKQELLSKQFDISLDQYSKSFYRGNAIYKKPMIVETSSGSVSKNKWHVEKDLIRFADDKSFVQNILKNGHDIYRI